MKFPIPVESVTLDLDGTLLDTVPDLAAAANGMLQELGLPPRSVEEIRVFVGRGIPNLVKRCVTRGDKPEEDFLRHATGVFSTHYAATNGRQAAPYPGVIEGLAAFRRMGLRMACVTNKAAAFSEPLLDMTGLAEFIELTVSGDTLPEKKPHPLPLLHACETLHVKPSHNLHIGDSRHDAFAARAAGCPVFCVPYGYNEGADVRELECDAIVATLDEAASHIVKA